MASPLEGLFDSPISRAARGGARESLFGAPRYDSSGRRVSIFYTPPGQGTAPALPSQETESRISRIAKAVGRGYEAVEQAPAVAASYYAPGGDQVLSEGLTPRPPSISELVEHGGLTEDQIRNATYPEAIGRGVGGAIAEMGASPTNAAILLATGGAGNLGARMGLTKIPDLATAAAGGSRIAAAAQRLGSGYFAGTMGREAYRGARDIGRRIQAEGFSPAVAGEIAKTGMTGAFALGAATHALSPIERSAGGLREDEATPAAPTAEPQAPPAGFQVPPGEPLLPAERPLELPERPLDLLAPPGAPPPALGRPGIDLNENFDVYPFEAPPQPAYQPPGPPVDVRAEREFLTPDAAAAADAAQARIARQYLASQPRLAPAIAQAITTPEEPRLAGGLPAMTGPGADQVTFSPRAAEAAAEQGVRVPPRAEPFPMTANRDAAEARRLQAGLRFVPDAELKQMQGPYRALRWRQSLQAVRDEISRRQQEAAPPAEPTTWDQLTPQERSAIAHGLGRGFSQASVNGLTLEQARAMIPKRPPEAPPLPAEPLPEEPPPPAPPAVAAPPPEPEPLEERRRDAVLDRREQALPVGEERRAGPDRRALEAEPMPERRADQGLRKRVNEMTEEERVHALLTDEKTGLPNDRAFEEDADHPDLGGGVASMDMSGLKYFNDTHGHPAGDAVIRAAAQAIAEEPGVKGYRGGASADEFKLRGRNHEDVAAAAERIQNRLANAEVTATSKDGTVYRFKGLRLDFGAGGDFDAADRALYENRRRAVERGDRLDTGKPENRGQRPVGLVEEPAAGRHVPGQPPAPVEPPPPAEPARTAIRRPAFVEEARGQHAPAAREEGYPRGRAPEVPPREEGTPAEMPPAGRATKPPSSPPPPAPEPARKAAPARGEIAGTPIAPIIESIERAHAYAKEARPNAMFPIYGSAIDKIQRAASPDLIGGDEVRARLLQAAAHTLSNQHPELADALWRLSDRLLGVERPESKPGIRPGIKPEETPQTGHERLMDSVRKALDAGEKIDNRRLSAMADEAFGGTRGKGKYTPKDAYDALEAGVNKWVEENGKRLLDEDPRAALKELRRKVAQLPRQADRTEEQTPPTHAFVAAKALNARPGETVLEPSAGVGGLAVLPRAAGADVHVNEIAPRRVELLKALGFEPTSVDAEALHDVLPEDVKPTAIIMNPPFSATGGRVKAHKTEFGARHVEQALQRLEPGGRLVAIVGEGMAFEGPRSRTGRPGTGAAFRDWWSKIMDHYNVRANVGLPGEEYGKYGTTFGNQILVIDKTGPTPGVDFTDRLRNVAWGRKSSLEEALNVLDPIGRDRPEVGGTREPEAGRPVEPHPERLPENGGRAAEAPRGRDRGVQPGRGGPGRNDTGARPGEPGEEPRAVPAGEPGPRSAAPAEAPESGPVRAGGGGREDVQPGLPGGRQAPVEEPTPAAPAAEEPPEEPAPIEPKANRKAEEGATFVPYQPAKLKVPGLKKHPADIVEAASMAAVEPPDAKYKPAFPASVVKEGRLSDVGYESVVYAGQRHAQNLPDGKRAGYFVGDGTGVGKGRIIAGVVYDNFLQGRKRAVWMSISKDLMTDALRDLTDVAGKDAIPVASINDYGPAEAIDKKHGVIFTTYASLIAKAQGEKGQTRREQLEKWLGPDGVIVFDEAHKAKNVLASGPQGEGTATGKAVVDIQNNLPNARVTYVSATGATDIRNMAYMTRLGLWGPGTAFPRGFEQFMTEIDNGGVGAMEMVARDLKALGMYNSRTISYKGVEYREVTKRLSPDQRKTYDTSATAWQRVLQNIDNAINVTNGDSRARARAMSQFWAAQQRFFNQLITAMKVPAAIDQVETALKKGRSVVIGLINTGETRTADKVSKATVEGTDLEDLDFTPREVLAGLVDKSFPTVRYQEVTDPDTGRTVKEPTKDADGNLVHSKEALAMKQRLLDSLSGIALPDNPLDQIINHFGPDNVAELTGRKKRLIRDPKTGKVDYVTRASKGVPLDKVNLNEMKAFQNGDKRVAIISDAASTGISLHASNREKNQERRTHITLQLGWSADKQMQTFGRTHRSDQAHAPEYVLLSTDVGGEKRFSSTIARRLASLGAITKGQRDASGGGDLAKYNFETREGEAAVDALYSHLMTAAPDAIPGIENGRKTLEDMGILRQSEEGGSMIRPQDRRDVPRFLNRLLALDVDRQNAVFDEFYRLFGETVQKSKASGVFDEGVTDVKGIAIRMKGEPKVVNTDETTGATTSHYQLEVDRKTNPVKWDTVAGMLKDAQEEPDPMAAGFFRQGRSGRVVYAEQGANRTDPGSGAITSTMVLHTPREMRAEILPSNEFYSKWEPIKPAEAKPEWDSAVAKVPPVETRDMHILGGAILPLWDRLRGVKAGLDIVRATTDDGKRVVGVRLPKTEVEPVLRAIGVHETKRTPADVLKAVAEGGDTVPLVAGLKIRRAIIHGEPRIEVVTTGDENYSELRGMGLINERIDFKQRFFVPNDEATGVPVLEKLLKRYPAMAEEGAPPVTTRGRKYSVKPAAEEGAGGIAAEHVRAAFPRGQVTEREGGYLVDLPGGRKIRVDTRGEIAYQPGNFEAGYQRSLREGEERLVGAWTPLGRDGIIQLAKEGADQGTVHHEAFHAAMDLVLSDGERRAVLKKYGNEEAAAEAYSQWKPSEQNGLFQRVRSFFQRIYRAFRPSWESAFGKVRSGEAFERSGNEAAPPDAEPSFSTTGTAPDFKRRMSDLWDRLSESSTPGKSQDKVVKRYLNAVENVYGDAPEFKTWRAAAEEVVREKTGTEPLKYATAPKVPPTIKPIPARPTAVALPPAPERPLGRTMRPGEAPRVEHKVEALKEAEPAVRLSRDAPRTWESLDPAIRSKLADMEKTPDKELALYERARSGRLNDVEVQTLDALVAGKHEAYENVRERYLKAQEAGRDAGPESVQYLEAALDTATANLARAAKADVEAGTRLGRALAARARVMDAAKGGIGVDQTLRSILRQIPDINEERAAGLLKIMRERPQDLADALIAATKPTLFDKYLEWWKAGLVSAPGTQGANILGNVGEQIMRLGETATAAALDPLLGGTKTRLSGEARVEFAGAMRGISKSLGRLGTDLKDVLKLAPEKIDIAHLERLPKIEGAKGRLVRIPFRFLSAFDDFFKGVGREAELHKLAYRRAGGDLAEAQKIVENPPQDLMDEVKRKVLERVYQDPNRFATSTVNFRNNHKWLHLIAPFIQTPANIAAIAWKRTPAGFYDGFKALKAYRDAIGKADPAELARLKGEAVDKLARPLFGTAVMGAFYAVAKAGGMTGSGPTDPKDKNLLRDAGWQPYSFVLPVAGGKHLYVPFNRFEPVSSLLGLVADAKEAGDEKKAGDLFEKALGSLVQNFTSKTYLQGLADAASALSDPEQKMSSVIASFGGSQVPNIIAKAAQAVDPVVRDTRPQSAGLAGIPERVARTIAARIPGASLALPARRSGTGEEIERPGGPLARFLSPVVASTDQPGGDVKRYLVDIDAAPEPPGRDITVPNSNGRKVRLDDREYAVLANAAKQATTRLESIVRDQRFRSMAVEEQRAYVRRIFDRYETAARKSLYASPAFRAKALAARQVSTPPPEAP